MLAEGERAQSRGNEFGGRSSRVADFGGRNLERANGGDNVFVFAF